ncbi:glutathione S-transferase family protein [Lysobacter arvi]|uniref:Glutathione S-transferase family protein n=1 Tax=Lysobacter arvi TaxID=3038776 RepID=A0ABU1C9K6_9GAMM|nr:glutathione S-transferase family protein [Lysobacter arvi]MDR0181879.1 glutathione S-transferase family protein [Lysobacter arvi]
MTAPILFYGVPSGCSFGSIVALEWLGLPYRLCRIEMPKDIATDAYRRINPMGETPTLRTRDGTYVSESLAILNHLAAEGIAGGLGFAQGTAGFDRLNQTLAFLNTTFFGAYAPLWFALEHGGDAEQQRVLKEYGRAQVHRAHALLSRMLGDKPWLLGEERSLADAYFVGIARWNDYHQVVDRREFPQLQRLFETLQDDPAVRFAHAIEAQAPAVTTGRFLGEIGLDEASRL